MVEGADNAGKVQMDAIPPQSTSEGKILMDRMERMAQVIEQETGHWLLQFNAKKLESLHRIDYIVVVGPSSSGKSTIVDVAREWTQSDEGVSAQAVVPTRIVTRPTRPDDLVREENIFARTPQEYEEMTRRGFQWYRKMENGRIERYGFGPAPENALLILSANNAFLSSDAHLSGVPADFFERALVFFVYAAPWIRSERIGRRSPDMKPAEVEIRLADMPEYVGERAHITLRTRGLEKERKLSADTMRLMLRKITEIKKMRQPS